jgi:RNA polymerase sigma-70 factor, ECF subfamily
MPSDVRGRNAVLGQPPRRQTTSSQAGQKPFGSRLFRFRCAILLRGGVTRRTARAFDVAKSSSLGDFGEYGGREPPLIERRCEEPFAVTSPGIDPRALVDEHYALVYRLAFRWCGQAVDAEDLTQQTFLQAYEHRHQLRDPRAAKSWLVTILRRVFVRSLRRRGGIVATAWDASHEPAVDMPDRSEQDELQQALQDLPEEFRLPVVLFYFDQFSYREIADVLEIPLGTVMSRLSRARHALRQKLTRSLAVVQGAVTSAPEAFLQGPHDGP